MDNKKDYWTVDIPFIKNNQLNFNLGMAARCVIASEFYSNSPEIAADKLNEAIFFLKLELSAIKDSYRVIPNIEHSIYTADEFAENYEISRFCLLFLRRIVLCVTWDDNTAIVHINQCIVDIEEQLRKITRSTTNDVVDSLAGVVQFLNSKDEAKNMFSQTIEFLNKKSNI